MATYTPVQNPTGAGKSTFDTHTTHHLCFQPLPPNTVTTLKAYVDDLVNSRRGGGRYAIIGESTYGSNHQIGGDDQIMAGFGTVFRKLHPQFAGSLSHTTLTLTLAFHRCIVLKLVQESLLNTRAGGHHSKIRQYFKGGEYSWHDQTTCQ